MRTAWIVTLTLLLIALMPMWPYPEPWTFTALFGGLLAVVLLVAVHTTIIRPHHWPH
jgi:hypothetical protein